MTRPDRDQPDAAPERTLEARRARSGDDALLARVKRRVMATIEGDGALAPEHGTVRAGGAGWEALATGVERKVLWREGDLMACMLRCAPGAAMPGHFHPVDEECVVLQGSLRIEPGIVLQAGDFHLGRQGTRHGVATTDGGCLVYLRGALEHTEP